MPDVDFMPPLPPSNEKRKGPRRLGIGRRTHGERRTTSIPAPPDGPNAQRHAREEQRRALKRRLLFDRRAL
jgi:hypothetical protein